MKKKGIFVRTHITSIFFFFTEIYNEDRKTKKDEHRDTGVC